MRNIAFSALAGIALFASPTLAQKEQSPDPQLYIPPPAPPPLDAMEGDEPLREVPNQRAYVSPSNYEALGPKPSDYPPEAWIAGQEGDVGYILYVGDDGEPLACEVTESSGFELLDDATCKLLMERTQFEPARDADSNPVAGEFTSRYRWTRREPEFPGSVTVHVAFTVREDGTVDDCETLEISGAVSERMRRQIDREPCPGVNSKSGVPFRDEEGVPVAKRVNLLLKVEVEDLDK